MAYKLDQVIEAEALRLEQAFADLAPNAETRAAMLSCSAYSRTHPRLAALWGVCQTLSRDYLALHRDAICTAVFDGGKAPETLRTGRLALGSGESVPLDDLLCDPLVQMRLTRHGGIFSEKTYELSFPFTDPLDDAAGRVSAMLVAAEPEGMWKITAISVTPGGLRPDLDPNAAETLGLCLSDPLQCIN